MSDFCTAAPKRISPDPNKRVNYTLGLVLGVDEFQQDQAHFQERDRQHNRGLHGYGTLCGLNLSVDKSQVLVSGGLAIDPPGRVIVVSADQCGDINEWLSVAANQKLVGDITAVTPTPFSLYVTLCYSECLTDRVPIPGAPCRSEEETMDYSRVTETFQLKFSPTPPPGSEEQTVHRFGDLLQRVQVNGSGPGPFLNPALMAGHVRALLPGSPAPGPMNGPLLLKPADAEAVLRTAFRVWATEVHPKLLAGGANCAGGPPAEDCILLGKVNFAITLDWKVAPAAVVSDPMLTLVEDERPFLLNSRLLQEWIMRSFTGNFVERPAGLPAYSIAAAGWLTLPPAQPHPPVYDPGLKMSAFSPTQVEITFTNYEMPPGTQAPGHMYIVKAMLVANQAAYTTFNLRSPVVTFDSFTPTGILLSVLDNGAPVDPSFMKSIEIMVEISRFEG